MAKTGKFKDEVVDFHLRSSWLTHGYLGKAAGNLVKGLTLRKRIAAKLSRFFQYTSFSLCIIVISSSLTKKIAS